MTRTPLALFLAAALAAPGARAANLTLEQCVAIALNESPDAASASYEVEAASFRKQEAFGGYGPRLHVDAGLQRWDSTYALPLFGSLKQYCTSCPWNPSVPQQTAPDGSVLPEIATEALVLRPQWTWSAAATVAQPIGALWTVREANLLAQLGIDVAEIRRRTARRDIAYQVVEAYYRVLEAKRLAEVAEKSVEQVTAQVSQAHIFYESGTVARNDVLRAELGLAAAQQRLIQAKGGVTLARGHLATVMGREPTAAIDVVDSDGRAHCPCATPRRSSRATGRRATLGAARDCRPYRASRGRGQPGQVQDAAAGECGGQLHPPDFFALRPAQDLVRGWHRLVGHLGGRQHLLRHRRSQGPAGASSGDPPQDRGLDSASTCRAPRWA